MNDREKLEKLVHSMPTCISLGIEGCEACQYGHIEDCYTAALVDYLLTNGVTFDEDINVPTKWIPVTERLPEECKDVLVYRITGCEVDSCVSHPKAYWSYDPVSQYPVTHWMPLPEPPKEDAE